LKTESKAIPSPFIELVVINIEKVSLLNIDFFKVKRKVFYVKHLPKKRII
jgi:hypothetical protein